MKLHLGKTKKFPKTRAVSTYLLWGVTTVKMKVAYLIRGNNY